MARRFEEWRAYCFDREVTEPAWYERVELEERSAFLTPEPSELASNLADLFEHAAELPANYSDAQIGQGLWFIASTPSGYFQTAREPAVPVDSQIRWVRAVLNLYSQVFAGRCAPQLGHRAISRDSGLSRMWTRTIAEHDPDTVEIPPPMVVTLSLPQPIRDGVTANLGMYRARHCAEDAESGGFGAGLRLDLVRHGGGWLFVGSRLRFIT